MDDQLIISQTEAWIRSVVIGCNFCPFAAKAMLKNSIRYVVWREATIENTLEKLIYELHHLGTAGEVETTLILLPDQFENFEAYLDLVEVAETLITRLGYEGVYQLASFHPQYLFAESYEEDPANYTNRSVYPMLHILREDSVSKAVENHPDAGAIPMRNVEFAKRKGLAFMQSLRDACFT